ncbi:MAG TPA: polysaccharide pyruvyl transferase family protein [Candidatus Limnocylindrales bacterium]|nr:polysaccharide pyruvyl transferase family protein [Candidatus Limnocylindrales bacterium]
MTRILLRATKSPFEVRSPRKTLDDNLIAGNSGNLVFMDAAWKLLSAPGADITPDRLEFKPRHADEINERYDVYVVPLANAFRLSFEATLVRMTEVIRRLRIPVIVLGVGAQGSPDYGFDAIAPMERSVRDFVGAVLDRSPSIGVRGEATLAYLNGLGFRDIEVIGCPSMFMWGTNLRVERRVPALDETSRIAITISPYRSTMGPIVLEACRRFPNLTYYAQDRFTLELLLKGTPLPNGTPDAAVPTHPDHPLFRDNRTKLFIDPWPWIEDLRHQDFSFGTRIHGSIAALIAGTPTTVITHDSRTLELARYFEIPYRELRRVSDGLDPVELHETADFTALNEGHAARFETFTRYMTAAGLDNAFAHEGAPEAFDARIAGTRFPGPVTIRSSAETSLLDLGGDVKRKAWRVLGRRRGRALRTWLARHR